MAASDEAELLEVRAMITRVLTGGQEIENNGRRVKLPTLAELRARENELTRRIGRAAGTSGVKTAWPG